VSRKKEEAYQYEKIVNYYTVLGVDEYASQDQRRERSAPRGGRHSAIVLPAECICAAAALVV